MSTCDLLDEFLDGELDAQARAAFERHLGGCPRCARALHDQLQLAARLDQVAEARREAAEKRRREQRGRVVVVAGALGLAAAAAVVLAMRHRSPETLSGADAELARLLPPTRPTEARIGLPAFAAHRDYDTRMGATSASPSLATFHSPDPLTEAAARLWSRDAAAAERALAASTGGGRDYEGLSAIVDLETGHHEQALGRLDALLDAAPEDMVVRWNRALARQKLGLDLAAAEDFEVVAGRGERGWSDEARGRAGGLRLVVERRSRGWYETIAAGESMVRGGAPMPDGLVKDHAGTARYYFNLALRAAETKERVLGLRGLARSLDEQLHITLLSEQLETIAASDFARRAPLARRFLQLLDEETPAEPLLAELEAAGQPDLLLGALGLPKVARRHIDQLESRAAASRDPWYQALASYEAARKLEADGDLTGAQLRLERALGACWDRGVDLRCAWLEHALAGVRRKLHLPSEADQQLKNALRWTRQAGEWSMESALIADEATVAHYHTAWHLARAIGRELALRRDLDDRHREGVLPDDGAHRVLRRTMAEWSCKSEEFRGLQMAQLALEELRVDEARQLLGGLTRCGKAPPQLEAANLLADLAALTGDAAAASRSRQILSERSGLTSDGERATVAKIAARLDIGRDRGRGEAEAREAIAEAKKLPPLGVEARRVRSSGYGMLIEAAAAHGEWPRAWELFADELGAAVPARCAVGLSADLGRAVMVAIDAQGRTTGRVEARSRDELTGKGIRASGLLSGMAGCRVVDVFARAPFHGRPGLLPDELAWRFRTTASAVAPRAAAAPRRVVVSGVTPPERSGLPPLPAWFSAIDPGGPGSQGGVVPLLGVEASPARVLEELGSATEVLFHVHGIVDAEISDVSHLVLSPDRQGSYALTARQIRGRTLAGHPLIILAACHAAEPGPYRLEPWSLPMAFIEAGAGAVLAATAELSHRESELFFDRFREATGRGAEPAEALRDARLQALGDNPSSTLRTMMLFQ